MADPQDLSPELLEHRRTCPACAPYTERLLRFESRLAQALRVELPAGASPVGELARAQDTPDPSGRVVPLRSRAPGAWRRAGGYRRGWLAMAASVLLAIVVAGALWLAVPGPTLAADVVKHMAEEPGAWRATDVPVPDSALQEVLKNSHLRIKAGAGMVSYASSCGFRGQHVPHLVVQTRSGPITVMVLVHERSTKPVQFDEQGYRGVILPVAGHGSLAVLAHDPATDLPSVERVAATVLDSIEWTG